MISDTNVDSGMKDYAYYVVILSIGLEKKHKEVLNRIRRKKKVFRYRVNSAVKILLEIYNLQTTSFITLSAHRAIKIVLHDLIDKTSERLRVKILTTLVLHDL